MTREELNRIFTHIPEIETERLLLRRILPKDADAMYEYSCDKSVTRFLLWDTHPDYYYTREYIEYLQERYALGDFFDWAIVLKSTGCMIGTCGFTNFDLPNSCAEIGYVLNPRYRGNGYAPEAASRIIDFAFKELSLERVSAICMEENDASLRVMQKCGMTREGTLRHAVYAKGKHCNVVVCSILKGEYLRWCKDRLTLRA